MNSLLDKLRGSYIPKKRSKRFTPKLVKKSRKKKLTTYRDSKPQEKWVMPDLSLYDIDNYLPDQKEQDLPGITDHIYKTPSTHIELPSSWEDNRTEKRIIDQFHYRYLSPIIRYNVKNKITTTGITLPSDGWVWEQELAKNFKKIGANFNFIGIEGAKKADILKRFLAKSYKLNHSTYNFKTECYVGIMRELMENINSSRSIKLNCTNERWFYPVDFIYADFMGYWAGPSINTILSIFYGPRKIKKGGCFFMSIYLARGSKDKDVRRDTIEIGKNVKKQMDLGLNHFNIHDSNYLLRDSTKKSGELFDLVRGIGAFTWKMAHKQGIQLLVHDVQIYYNEYVNESGREVRSPMASFYFTKLND
jgi:hypothetical protein